MFNLYKFSTPGQEKYRALLNRGDHMDMFDSYSMTHISFTGIIFTRKCIIQSNVYLEVTFGTKKKWPYNTGDLLKEVKFIWN
jgi:hypothetical protein